MNRVEHETPAGRGGRRVGARAPLGARRAWVDDALHDPSGFLAQAPDLLTVHGNDPDALVLLRWAHGLAWREAGEFERARAELEAAVRLARERGANADAALIVSSLAAALMHLGEMTEALRATERAAEVLQGLDAARNTMQRGLILQRLGHQQEAVAAYDLAAGVLVEHEDDAGAMRLFSNRGILHAYRGALTAARSDLERSRRLAQRLGAARGVAFATQNLGFVAGRQGRIPDALALFAQAEAGLRAAGEDATSLAALDLDHAEVLADAGLLDEAIARADAAREAFEAADDHPNAAEAGLLVARLALQSGAHERALTVAEQARTRFARTRRYGWERQAAYVVLAATARRGDDVDLDGALELADRLARDGWSSEARAARLLVAQRALAADAPAIARQALRPVAEAGRDIPALAQAQRWDATARLRLLDGDRTGARRAIGLGLRAVERSRLAFGSAELRAHAAQHAVDLVRMAIGLALADGRPVEALQAVDRVRAVDLLAPVEPPADAQLAADLEALRRVDAEARRTALEGGDLRSTTTERIGLERHIRARTRAALNPSRATAPGALDVAQLRRALRGRTLASYFVLDDRLHAIVVTPGATRHHELAAVGPIRADIQHLRAGLRRLARGGHNPAAQAAARASVQRSAGDLAGALGLAGPADRATPRSGTDVPVVDPDGLVLVPCGALDGLPWSALAPISGHVPTVAPSARAWLAAQPGVGPVRAPASDRLVFVAGPDLPGGALEVAALAADASGADGTYGVSAGSKAAGGQQVEVLTGAEASTAAVFAAMEGAGIVHVVAHGRFRADNPLFSSLRLADGAAWAYEFERVRRPPETLVLSSCEAALTSSTGGDAVFGLASALLRQGVRHLVAPVVEIPDTATAELMRVLHRRLRAGDDPATALGTAVAGFGDQTPQQAAVAGAFVVMGA